MAIVAFLLRNSLIIFLIALIAQIAASRMVRKGDLKKARPLAWASLIAAGLLTLMYGILLLLAHDLTSGIMTAVWAYFTWHDWQFVQQLRGPRRRR